MITTDLQTLRIHQLTKAQYDRERENGSLDENALYLLPDEENNLTKENIIQVLGYTPLKASSGIAGQFAISDGEGGITWQSLTNVGEVGA